MERSRACFKGSRTLAVGFALGFLVGSAGAASAAFGHVGWDRFGLLFKQGYVAGFIDCVRIAKAIDPFSYIATNFPAPPRAKPIVWVRTIDELYQKDEHKDRSVAQILIIAGTKLEKDFGDEGLKPGDQRLEALRQAIDRQRKALLQARKTVEAAQGEVKANGEKPDEENKDDAAKADAPAAVEPGGGESDKRAGDQSGTDNGGANDAAKSGTADEKNAPAGERPEKHVEQAPPTPEGLRQGIAPESHGETARPPAETEGPKNDTQE